MKTAELTKQIKRYIEELEFDEYRIIPSTAVNDDYSQYFKTWIDKGYEAGMQYMQNNSEKRLNPNLLVDNAKTIIVFALNYYPSVIQAKDRPQIAYYAYGEDYHEVIKERLNRLFQYIQSLNPNIEGRYFCDTAPVLERYWAKEAKIGWIGKNSMLIIPQKGSYYFLASMILDTALIYDNVEQIKMPSCVNCTKCIDACPTQAIVAPYQIDANRCISYQTIENKSEEIPQSVVDNLSNRLYGCDICQQVCPWNRFSSATKISNFAPKEELLSLSLTDFLDISQESYSRIFKKSPMKRAKLKGIIRNAKYLQDNPINKNDEKII